MNRHIKVILLLIIITAVFTVPVLAKGRVKTKVKVIHASTRSNHIDPGLAPIISEIGSVFKYTSYRLISSDVMNLGVNQTGRVSLPGKRSLVLTPLPMKGKRIPYQINILKKKRSAFQTKVLLKNNSSVTIGGPAYKDGVLLFNIRGSVR